MSEKIISSLHGINNVILLRDRISHTQQIDFENSPSPSFSCGPRKVIVSLGESLDGISTKTPVS